MLDRYQISRRFFLCYQNKSRNALAKLFAVRQPTVTEWATQGTVPWSKLKFLSDSQAISWDWLIDGMEPKESTKKAAIPNTTSPQFDRAGITKRYLSLFSGRTQTQIAAQLEITTTTVSNWLRNVRAVGWERLDGAVQTFGVSWDWLIDGLEPKLRGDDD